MAGTITRRRFNFDDEPEAGQPPAIPASYKGLPLEVPGDAYVRADPMAERFLRDYERVKREQFEIEEVSFAVRASRVERAEAVVGSQQLIVGQLSYGLFEGIRKNIKIDIYPDPTTGEIEYRASLLLARKKQ